ncbi:hypothetical protein [Herbiconiux liangxiaofengii]|uniref:hypothetical protein n=1 Tax=Herbiconiux liangxiaofengii TaxID=3342795 RepID=UPI0035B8A182
MDRIHYSGESVLTGTTIAQALLEYGRALAKQSDSAVIDIPIRRVDGSIGRAEFLIGPASQLVSEKEPDDDQDELEDDAVVDDLRLRTAQLEPSRPVTGATGAVPVAELDFDEL